MSSPLLWNIETGAEISTLIERREVTIQLPIANGYPDVELELISGDLPAGTRLEGTKIVGFAYEVQRDTVFTGVLRAHYNGYFDDRTIKIVVTGADDPEWRTPEGLLPVGNNGLYFILDNQLVDFHLFAQDNDLPAGDELEYFIAKGDGVLPEGLQLEPDGRITGISEPLLSLDKRFQGGQYDTMPYGTVMDYAVLPNNGFSSYFYDSQTYDFAEITQSLRKLNRYYPFAVTVTDGDTYVRREFRIYLVGDDYLRADNTIMSVSTGVFTADNTHVRTPRWITPSDLGVERANNYVTLPLQIIEDETLVGTVTYTLEDLNNDGTVSELPKGMSLDSDSGILAGRVPYQPAVSETYNFTVTATRVESDLENISIFANFYEDVLLGATSFKIFKIDLTSDDGVEDLKALKGRDILLNKRSYTVTNVDDSNEDFDIVFVDDSIAPNISLIVSRQGINSNRYFFSSRLKENEKQKYLGSALTFASSESYTIQKVEPYLEYQVQSVDLATADINTVTNSLATAFGNDVYIEQVDSTVWNLTMPSTGITRIKGNLKNRLEDLNITAEKTQLIRDNEDRIYLDIPLQRNLTQGRNIGIALFEGDFFRKDLVIASNDEVTRPSTTKTFSVKIIGEIDSNISWITPTNLGILKANFTSTLGVQAETTVPDTEMIYRIVKGSLPFGLHMNYSGEIIGIARQYEVEDKKGLTRFDNGEVSWDGNFPGDTTFDREFKFTVQATDRVGLTEIEREFVLTIDDLDDLLYTDVFLKPMLKQEQRLLYNSLVSDNTVFTPEKIYRPDDSSFGVQTELKMLAYAGIEARSVREFIAATAKNHKRKKYRLGSFKKAEAKVPGTNNIVYEVIYIEAIDPAAPTNGKARESFSIDTKNKITVDSVQFHPNSDNSNLGLGVTQLPVFNRQTVDFIFPDNNRLFVETRTSDEFVLLPEEILEITVKDNGTVEIQLEKNEGDPFRFRPKPKENTIKADSDAVKASDSKDQTRYLSNIDNMRDRLRGIGITEGDYLPLWMRTPQQGLQALGYVTAVPVCYCKPGTGDDILLNIQKAGFDLKKIDFEVDRYIIDRTAESEEPQFILFANYQFNV